MKMEAKTIKKESHGVVEYFGEREIHMASGVLSADKSNIRSTISLWAQLWGL